MGLGLSKPQQPLPILALAVSTPALYPHFLRFLEARIPDPSLGAGLKTYGVPFFILGHVLQVSKRPKGFPEAADKTDWSYIIACIFLGAAFAGTYKNRPFPAGVLISGIILYGFGLPMRQRCLAAGVSTTLPLFATAAATTLAYLGCILLGLKHGLLKQPPPGLSPPQYAQLASSLFGLANVVKFLQMLQGGVPSDRIFGGQSLKVLASMMLFSGNGLGLGWQRIEVPGEILWKATAGLSVGMLVAAEKNRADGKKVAEAKQA